MAIKFEHNGRAFEVETPEQAVTLLELLDARANAKEKQRETSKRHAKIPGFLRPASEAPKPVRNADRFARFIERLGDPQKIILEFLMLRRIATDEELRTAVGVADNNVLAGVLSGISKQALAEKIDPREVFYVRNMRSKGRRRNKYGITDVFWNTARELDWPGALRKGLFPEWEPRDSETTDQS